MSETEELRKLLDERGIEHKDSGFTQTHWYMNITCWMVRGITYYYVEEDFGDGDHRIDFGAYRLPNATPEQAIEATLGRGTCHIVSDGEGWWECDECGCPINWDDSTEPPRCNYCPNCGRRVVE